VSMEDFFYYLLLLNPA